MKAGTVIRRFLIPSIFVSAYYYLKFRCIISPRAEVELSSLLEIGRKTGIGSFTKIKASYGPLRIGSHCSIGTNCAISSDEGGVYIGDDCLIGSNVTIISNSYRYDDLETPMRLQARVSKGVHIGDNVFIGPNSCINDGAQIGSGAIIAPGSMVTGKIPENTVAQGAPAKPIFKRR